jgi:arylsulfatase A-like enzyme
MVPRFPSRNFAAPPRATCWRRLALAIGVAALAGCGPQPEPRPIQRYLDDGEALANPPADARLEVRVAEWAFDSSETLAAWLAADLQLTVENAGTLAVGAGGDPRMSRAVDLDADLVAEIRLEGCGDQPSILYWMGAGERPTEERRQMAQAEGECRQTFQLAGHPGWHGRIRRLLLKPVASGGRRKLERLVAGRQADAHRDLARTWRVDLAGDQRLAQLSAADTPWRRTLEVPAAARFRAFCGPTTVEAPIGCRISVRTAAQDPPREVAASTPAAGWAPLDLDLGLWAGRQIELRIEPVGGTDALAAIAAPELWAPRPAQRRTNVVLIVVDTLRADRLGLYGSSRPTSPAIDAWARRRGVIFEQAVAPAPWTLPSHASMLSGLDALRHGINYDDPAPGSLDLMAEKLRRQGYRTIAFTGGAYLAPYYGLSQGFERFHHGTGSGGLAMVGAQPAPAGKDLARNIEHALAWLEGPEAHQPFFLFLHTYEVHAPLLSEPRPPALAAEIERALDERGLAQAKLRVGSEGEGWTLSEAEAPTGTLRADGDGARFASLLYDAGVARADALLDRLLDRLRSSGLERETLVILTSDHGEALGEHGLSGHDALYDVNLLVPLIVARPDGAGAGRRVPTQVRLIDLVPTVLEAAGLPAEPGLDGRSLQPWLEGGTPSEFPKMATAYAASNNRGLALRWDGRSKLIWPNALFPGPKPASELYDLRQDPAELHDLASDPGRAQLLSTLEAEGRHRYRGAGCPWRLHLANPADGRLVAKMVGGGLSPFRLKTLEPPAGVTFAYAPPQIVELTVAAGGGALLCFEAPYPAEIALSLSWLPRSGPPKTGEFALRLQAGTTRSFHLKTGGGFIVGGRRLAPGAPGLAVEAGAARAETEAPAPMDAELRRQLESLGYVD